MHPFGRSYPLRDKVGTSHLPHQITNGKCLWSLHTILGQGHPIAHVHLLTADVIFVADAGGESTSLDGPTLSVDTRSPRTCPLDAPTSSRCTMDGTWLGTTCCKECMGVAATFGIFGCFSTNDATQSNLGQSISLYQDRMPDNTAPPFPMTPSKDKKIGQRVLIFGCDTVRLET